MTDFVFATTPVNSAIPVVTVMFTLNNLIFDEPDPLDQITVTVNLISDSPVIDDNNAILYGWPRTASSTGANHVTVIPLPATKDASQSGNHITNVNGTDVHYTLTVTGTKNGEPVNLIDAQPFNIDAATPNGTNLSTLTLT